MLASLINSHAFKKDVAQMLHKLIQNIKEEETHYFVNPVLT